MATAQQQQPPNIDSYMALPYFRDQFMNVWEGKDHRYVAEIRMTAHEASGTVAETQILKDPQDDTQRVGNTFLRLDADVEMLQKLNDYLHSEAGQFTTLMYIVLGMTKDPVEHVLGIVAEENFSAFFVLSKGQRVVKGGKVSIQDIKNGRVTITV